MFLLRGLSFGRVTAAAASMIFVSALGCGDDSTSSPDGGRPDGGGKDASTDAGADGNGSGGDSATADAGADGVGRYLPPFAPGSRLAVKAFGAPGEEPALFATFYDTELEIDCSFRRATDGEMRCMPPEQFGSIEEQYVDDSCSEPLYARQRPECGLTYRSTRVAGTRGCISGPQLRIERLEPTTVPEEMYHIAGGECMGPLSYTHEEAFTVTEVEPETFVRATVHDEGDGAGLGVRILEGEDGSRRVSTVLDTRHTVSCSPRRFVGDDTLRCLSVAAPVLGPSYWWFGDEGCSDEPLAHGNKRDASCAPFPFGRVVDMTDEWGELVELSEREAGTVYDSREGCTPSAADDVLWDLFHVVGPAPLDQLLPLERRPFGEQSLPAHFNAASDGTLLTVHALYDPDREQPCRPMRTAEETMVCVPDPMVLGTEGTRTDRLFADEACDSERLVMAIEPTPAAAYVTTSRGSCPDLAGQHVVDAVYPIGEPYETGPIYVLEGDECVEAERSELHHYFRRDDAALESLPAVQVTTLEM